MKSIQSLLLAAVMITVCATPSRTMAHENHGKKVGPVVKEQKDWGIAGDAKAGMRTVRFTMADTMRFTPDTLEVRLGETVRLVIKNNGAMRHEFVLGTKKELDEHAALMVKFPTMEHSEPYMAHVDPGKTGEIVWTFNRAGDFDFACLIAGHYQAGMVGTVKVLAATPAAGAEVVTIHWSGEGRFMHKSTIAPGKFVELCGKLPAGLKVRWDFDAGLPLDFNVHYHVGKEVVFPFKLGAVSNAKDVLDTRIEQDYCWMWSNKSAAPASLSVKLQRG